MTSNGTEQRGGFFDRILGRDREVISPREWEVATIRGVQRGDMIPILRWVSNPDVMNHLDPAPEVPTDWNDPELIKEKVDKLYSYYMNVGENGVAEPEKIIPVIIENVLGDPIAVNTIRLKGDKYIRGIRERERRIASDERTIVNPRLWGKGLGTLIWAVSSSIALDRITTYSGKPADEVRLWVMTDPQAVGWDRNMNLAYRLGFVPVQGENVIWHEFAEDRGIKTDRRATWMTQKREAWEKYKITYSQVITKINQVLDVASLRNTPRSL